MKNEQKIAIVAPLILTGSMYGVFQILSRSLGETLGWYLRLILYWLLWEAAFPLWIIGKENIRRIIQRKRFNGVNEC